MSHSMKHGRMPKGLKTELAQTDEGDALRIVRERGMPGLAQRPPAPGQEKSAALATFRMVKTASEERKPTYPISRFLNSHGLTALGGSLGALNALRGKRVTPVEVLLQALVGGGSGYVAGHLQRAIEARALRGRARTGYKHNRTMRNAGFADSEARILKALRDTKD